MRRRSVAALLAVTSTVLAGCGDAESVRSSSSLPPAPPGVAEGCRAAAETASFEVICPTRWPEAARPRAVRLNVMDGDLAYLLEEQDGFGSRSPVFHVLFGGQKRPFPAGFKGAGKQLRVTTRLETTPIYKGGERTSRRFVVSRPTRVVGKTRVHRQPAAILRAPSYPKGGIHGDHAIVMWNQNDHGYLVSTHSETSHRAATRAAIQIARFSRPMRD